MNRWLLPEQVTDLLPREAETVEFLRREFLALFKLWGYELIASPLIEYLDSLLVGAGRDLAEQTFKLVDLHSGKLLALRPDMTPQMARIDAHLNSQGTMRLTYAGSVLRTKAPGPFEEKELYQVGAELFGCPGIAGDMEILQLLRDAFLTVGCRNLHFDFGHIGLLQSILAKGPCSKNVLQDILEALNARDRKKLAPLLSDLGHPWKNAFLTLLELNGDIGILQEGIALLPQEDFMIQPLVDLQDLVAVLEDSGFSVGIDLANVEGYSYHTGMTFAVYGCDKPLIVARGGRYDGIGAAFGVSRPATGFSIDLKALASLKNPLPAPEVVMAPYVPEDAALQDRITSLRQQGFIVIQEFPGSSTDAIYRRITKALCKMDNQWQMITLNNGA
jgi:ATP phosphoribosyltransferase regulatory subunit